MTGNREFYTFRGYLMMQDRQQMTPSMEDYLEMIYRSHLQEGHARTSQLAAQLNVQAPSVTKTVQKLAHLGLLNYEKYGLIRLTEKGKRMGRFLLKRHTLIENFLKLIGVKEPFLLRDTEMIEHHLSLNAFHKIKLLYKFLQANPAVMEQFNRYKLERRNPGGDD
ncbi:MAG: transcriptional regulator MntR [Firmicutes bacterium]|jgi:Mn-dependent DtxR family transcriptional regulator|nr:transcriptional regulator MntR [Bacillota bacterium]HPU01994.1 transcriptional regulator MntR [Bacillota bacterium]